MIWFSLHLRRDRVTTYGCQILPPRRTLSTDEIKSTGSCTRSLGLIEKITHTYKDSHQFISIQKYPYIFIHIHMYSYIHEYAHTFACISSGIDWGACIYSDMYSWTVVNTHNATLLLPNIDTYTRMNWHKNVMNAHIHAHTCNRNLSMHIWRNCNVYS